MEKKKENKVRVILAVGGTGGHIFPAQQLASLLQKRKVPLRFAGYKLSSNSFFQKDTYPFTEIISGPLKRPWKIVKGVLQSLRLFREFKPTIVVGFGSYHTVPLLIAAKVFRCRLFLFEANTIPGRVTSLFSFFCEHLCVQFPLEKKMWKKATEVERIPWIKPKISGKRENKKKVILIFGGSQGAKVFNEKIPDAMANLTAEFEIIHIAGVMSEEVKKCYNEKNIPATVLSFSGKMQQLYLKADLVIGRSGASTIAELIYYEIPSILIPYPFATDQHQEKNALFLQKIGGAYMIPQLLLTPSTLAKMIEEIMEKKSNEMKGAIKQYKKNSTNKNIVDLILR